MTQKSEKNDLDCAGQKDILTIVTLECRILEILLKYQVVRKKSKIQIDPFYTIWVMYSHIAFAVHSNTARKIDKCRSPTKLIY